MSKCTVCGKQKFSSRDLISGYGQKLCQTCWTRLYAIDDGRRIAKEHPELEQYLHEK